MPLHSARYPKTDCDACKWRPQASNVATYIAHGDVALSVLMTTASTLGAIIMTPLLTGLLAGTLVPVDARVGPFLLLTSPGLKSLVESMHL